MNTYALFTLTVVLGAVPGAAFAQSPAPAASQAAMSHGSMSHGSMSHASPAPKRT